MRTVVSLIPRLVRVTTVGVIVACGVQSGAAPSSPSVSSAWPSPSTASPVIRISDVATPVTRGGVGRVVVVTRPAAVCTIAVEYSGGPSAARGLEPHTADGDGVIVWTWSIGPRTSVGEWPILIRCGPASAATTFTVR